VINQVGAGVPLASRTHSHERGSTSYYRFQINCTFLPKLEIFYMPNVIKSLLDVKNLPVDSRRN
jgi:hypothetical protein